MSAAVAHGKEKPGDTWWICIDCICMVVKDINKNDAIEIAKRGWKPLKISLGVFTLAWKHIYRCKQGSGFVCVLTFWFKEKLSAHKKKWSWLLITSRSCTVHLADEGNLCQP